VSVLPRLHRGTEQLEGLQHIPVCASAMLKLPARTMRAASLLDEGPRLLLRERQQREPAGETCHDLGARRLVRHMWGRELEKSARTSRHATITKETAGTSSTTKHQAGVT
jgi:hypothetical protein